MGVIVLGKTNLNVRPQTMVPDFGLDWLIDSCVGVGWIKVSWTMKYVFLCILTLFCRGDSPNPNGWSALGGQTNGAYMVREHNQIKFGQNVSLPPSYRQAGNLKLTFPGPLWVLDGFRSWRLCRLCSDRPGH